MGLIAYYYQTALSQVTKSGVIATTSSPEVVEITIPDNADYNHPGVEVLKFVPGAQDQTTVISDFNNGDATNFIVDGTSAEQSTFLVFDGNLSLATTQQLSMTDNGPLGSGHLWSVSVDKSVFNSLEKITMD